MHYQIASKYYCCVSLHLVHLSIHTKSQPCNTFSAQKDNLVVLERTQVYDDGTVKAGSGGKFKFDKNGSLLIQNVDHRANVVTKAPAVAE